MDLNKAESLARSLILQIVPSYSFEYRSNLKALGTCYYSTKVISLSREWTESLPEAEVRDTILHEIAHALAYPHTGHGKHWKDVCRAIGARPQAKACIHPDYWPEEVTANSAVVNVPSLYATLIKLYSSGITSYPLVRRCNYCKKRDNNWTVESNGSLTHSCGTNVKN